MKLTFKSIFTTMLSALLMVCIVSCKHESKNNNRHTDILEVTKIAQNKETVNGLIMYAEVADSLYAAGTISETMRDYLYGYFEFYEMQKSGKYDIVLSLDVGFHLAQAEVVRGHLSLYLSALREILAEIGSNFGSIFASV